MKAQRNSPAHAYFQYIFPQIGRFFPAFLFLLLSGFLTILDAQDSGKHAIGLEYLKAARLEFSAGHIDAALTQIDHGLEVDTVLSDLYLLRSQIKMLSSKTIRDSLSDAQNAIRQRSWVLADRSAGISQLMAVLIATHQWAEAAKNLDSLMNDREIVLYPELIAQKSTILYELGNLAAASQLLISGLSRHPDNFFLMNVAIHYRTIPTAAAFLWFNRFHSKSPEYVSALFWYMHHLEPGAEKLSRCSEYLAVGGRDPMVYADGLTSAQAVKDYSAEIEKHWLTGFLSTKSPLDLDVVNVFKNNIRYPDSVQQLNQVLTAPHLESVRDYDRDGRPEEIIVFKNGQVRFWSKDDDQNNQHSLSLDFSDGIPVRAWQYQDGLIIRLDYAAYPEVAVAWLRSPDTLSELIFAHRLEEMRFIDIPPEGLLTPLQVIDFYPAKATISRFDPIRLRSAAWLLNEYHFDVSHSYRIFRQTRFESGIPLAERLDSNNDGHFDTMALFEDGKKRIQFRDSQNDGTFSIVDSYEQGKPIEHKFVSPSDGFMYSLQPQTGLSKWDLNKDNRLNFQELLSLNSWLRESFSEKKDSNFDLPSMNLRYENAWKSIEDQGIH